MSPWFRRSRAWRPRVCCALLLTASFPGSLALYAQAYRVRPKPVRPNPEYVLPGGTLTVSATPASVSFALVSQGTAQGSSGVTITTSWNLVGIDPTLNVYGFFTSARAALSDGKTPQDLIPSSAVLGQVTGTGGVSAFTPFTQTTPFGGAGSGLMIVNTIPGFITLSGSQTNVLNLEINLSGVPLPAGTYAGTLTLQATMN